jgi:hypothetical protein
MRGKEKTYILAQLTYLKRSRCINVTLFCYLLSTNLIWVLLIYILHHLNPQKFRTPDFWLKFIFIYHIVMVILTLGVFPLLCIFVKISERKEIYEKIFLFIIMTCLIAKLTGYIGLSQDYYYQYFDEEIKILYISYTIFGGIEFSIPFIVVCGAICLSYKVGSKIGQDKNYYTEMRA